MPAGEPLEPDGALLDGADEPFEPDPVPWPEPDPEPWLDADGALALATWEEAAGDPPDPPDGAVAGRFDDAVDLVAPAASAWW